MKELVVPSRKFPKQKSQTSSSTVAAKRATRTTTLLHQFLTKSNTEKNLSLLKVRLNMKGEEEEEREGQEVPIRVTGYVGDEKKAGGREGGKSLGLFPSVGQVLQRRKVRSERTPTDFDELLVE